MFDAILSQTGATDIIGQIIYFAVLIGFFALYPRLIMQQTIWKLEKDITDLETLAGRTREIVARKIDKNPNKKLRESINRFVEFFAVSPVDLDPYGIVRKIDSLTRQSDARFTYFVKQVAKKMPDTDRMNVKNALYGAMTTHQIAKILRHNLEIVKKYKILQLAMVLQMQLPLIVRVAKASSHATKAFLSGIPIGDGIGPMVAASLVPPKTKIHVDKVNEFVVSKVKVGKRDVWVAKANGPGASTGFPGKWMRDFLKKNKIDRIITIDAALRMEGEKAGSLAEGVGVAMGGSGADRYEIEEVAVKNNLPLDAIAIKVSDEEALGHMIKPVYEAMPEAKQLLDEALDRAGKKENILIIGVGNTCGVGNDARSVHRAVEKLQKINKQMERQKKKNPKKEQKILDGSI